MDSTGPRRLNSVSRVLLFFFPSIQFPFLLPSVFARLDSFFFFFFFGLLLPWFSGFKAVSSVSLVSDRPQNWVHRHSSRVRDKHYGLATVSIWFELFLVCCCRIGLNIESIDIALEFESSFAIISLARFVNFKLIWYVSILDDFYSIWNALEMNLALFFSTDEWNCCRVGWEFVLFSFLLWHVWMINGRCRSVGTGFRERQLLDYQSYLWWR